MVSRHGYIDFAGSTSVHGVGGAAAFAEIIVIGARKRRFPEYGTPRLRVQQTIDRPRNFDLMIRL